MITYKGIEAFLNGSSQLDAGFDIGDYGLNILFALIIEIIYCVDNVKTNDVNS